jgi:hypothetical protein
MPSAVPHAVRPALVASRACACCYALLAHRGRGSGPAVSLKRGATRSGSGHVPKVAHHPNWSPGRACPRLPRAAGARGHAPMWTLRPPMGDGIDAPCALSAPDRRVRWMAAALHCCCTWRMDAERLAVELSSRMEQELPPGFTITADGSMLWFLDGDRRVGSYACQWIDSAEDSMEGLTLRACELALNDLQDFITESTTEPWPAISGQPPRPGARLSERTVEMWFGSEGHPVARLRPLPLDY